MTTHTPTLIAAGIAGALALGTGGYYANEWRTCRVLEADYMEEAAAIGTDLQSGAAMRDLVEEKQIGNRVATAMEKASRIYSRIRSKCGDEEAAEVQRKGLALVESIRQPPR